MQYMGVGNKLKAEDPNGLSCSRIDAASCWLWQYEVVSTDLLYKNKLKSS
jgi:hypothetical protein